MKLLIILVVFLLFAQTALALDIKVGNLTISIPKITINTTKAPVLKFNNTPSSTTDFFERLGVSDVVKETLNRFYMNIRDAIIKSIKESIERMPELVNAMVRNSTIEL